MSVSKIVAAAASGVGGGSNLALDDVFSTHLWDGTGSAQTITNGIDLSGEGGLVWIKKRSGSAQHTLQDTVRGATKHIRSSGDSSESTEAQTITAFNSNGFSLGTDDLVNASSSEYVGWTFRSQPKFCDILTYTGNGSARTISHNLGSVPAMIIIKRLNASSGWSVYHRGVNSGTNPEQYALELNGTGAQSDDQWMQDTAPTSTQFSLNTFDSINNNGSTYVAYLFAHHANDGSDTGFGSDGDSPVIACGYKTFSGNGEFTIDLGFEAQWVLWKRADDTSDWNIMDMMRPRFDVPASTGGGQTQVLRPNNAGAEGTNTLYMGPSSSGFGGYNIAGASTWIYMAIAHPVSTSEEPSDATKVFAVQDGRGASKLFTAGFRVDMFLQGDDTGDDWQLKDRLRQIYNLATNSSAAQTSDTFYYFDDQTGLVTSSGGGSALAQLTGYMWKRAKGFCDVLTYTGTGSATTIAHQLGVVPEMMWIKMQSSTQNWAVYHKGANGGTDPEDYALELNSTSAEFNTATYFNDTAPTSTVFTVGNGGAVNSSGQTFVAYLFATVAGVSKCGSFSHTNGSATDVDCGFSSGAKLVICKRTNDTGSWYIFDTARGSIVAGNDPHQELNSVGSETTGFDVIDPLSSGFTIASGFLSSGTYIFYAVA